VGVSILAKGANPEYSVDANICITNVITLESTFTSISVNTNIGIRSQFYVDPNLPLNPIDISAIIGISNFNEIVLDYVKINNLIGIGNSIELYRDQVLETFSIFGISSLIEMTNASAINELNAGLGVKTFVNIVDDLNEQINLSIGLKTTIEMKKDIQLVIIPMIGISGTITILGNSSDNILSDMCKIPDFNKLRWC